MNQSNASNGKPLNSYADKAAPDTFESTQKTKKISPDKSDKPKGGG